MSDVDSKSIDPRAIDPSTGRQWAPRLNTKAAARYYDVAQGVPRSPTTIAHDRLRGIGPKWHYVGQMALTTTAELDRDVEERLLRPVSPLIGRKRQPKPAAEAVAATWPLVDIGPAAGAPAKIQPRTAPKRAAKRRAQPSDG
jgi:hypothetical protein